ncbi:phage tail tape measure protein [Enterococcus faecalis]|uniref:tape measure protein n=1 Tax=Enterococcus faecalis TaxID=1351 RepID=UPI001AD6E9DC|nr:tape measure protein [Enterococcus faecalis]MBO6344097.1 phage tail tape measure protein [Enterococcus faecalis]MBO6362312.1 phage tail tape measure protein [Enterococcus faecalis]
MEQYSVEAILIATDKTFSSTMSSAERSMVGVNKQSGELGDGLDKSTTKGNQLGKSILSIGAGVGAVKLVSTAVNMVKDSVEGAINRFDTLNKYPVVMKALGYSTEDVDRSMTKLSDGIDGLPTSLDEIVSNTQQLAISTGSLSKGTDTAIALNDAFLASGASTADATRGMQQYIQMLGKGEVDMQSWRTLQETMPIAMDKVAKSFKEQGVNSVNQLYDALKEGDITFNEFNNRLIELDKGVGGFADLAKKNSKGIKTSWANIKTATVKGVTTVIKSFDELSKAVTGKNIAENLDSLKNVVNITFKAIDAAIQSTIPLMKLFGKAITSVGTALTPLLPTIASFAATFTALKVIQQVTGYIKQSELAIKAYTTAISLYNGISKLATLSTTALGRAWMLNLAADKANSVAIAIKTGLLVAQNTIVGVLTGTISLATVATTVFSTAMKLLMGPIGWVTAAIGGLVAVGVNLWKWLNKETESTKAVKKEQENLMKTTDDLIKKNQEHAQSRKDEAIELENTKEKYNSMISEMATLAAKEKLSNGEKKRMTEIVEELNGKMTGLNLVYDEQSNKLSEMPGKIQQQMDAYSALDKASKAQEDINKMLQQRNDNEAKLMEINAAREKWNQTLKESGGNTKEARENIAELGEQEKVLMGVQEDLRNDIINTAKTHESAMQTASQAVANGVLEQTVSYNALSGKTKETMDAMRAEYTSLETKVGSAFDVIEQKQAISVDQMAANLQKNQEAVAQWGQNISTLAERHVDQGLLEQLRKMGPEGAAQAAELVNASDEQLQRLNDVYRNTGETSMNAMKEGYQLGKNGVNEEIASLIPTQKDTLMTQIKNTNFNDIGRSVTEDFKAGIENGRNAVAEMTKGIVPQMGTDMKGEVEKANFPDIGKAIPQGLEKGIGANKQLPVKTSNQMIDDVVSGARKGLDSHSPSRVFHSIGEDVDSGLSNGIEQNAMNPVRAVESIVDKIISAMDKLPSEMNSIGANAIDGLTNGINANANSALAAARGVADQIVSTMKSAMDIHSPSRVMRDEVGKMIPAGVAVGIDKYSNFVEKSMQRLSKKVAMPALDNLNSNLSFSGGSQSLAFAGDVSSKLTVEVPVIFDSSEVARVIAKPMSKELQNQQDKKNVSLGRRR